MRPIVVTVAPVVDQDGIALSQTTGGAGDLTLDGTFVTAGVATLAAAQQVTLFSAGNISTVNFLIIGTDENGNAVNETILGPNATTVQTSVYFTTVTQITVDAAVASAVEVGSAEQTTSPILPVNWREHNFAMSLSVELSAGATVNYTVQFTVDDVQTNGAPFWFDTSNLISLTVSESGNVVVPVCAVRLIFNSFNAGTAKFTAKQGGN